MLKFVIIAVAAVASLAQAQGLEKYNFKYAGEGQKNILPVQVFDDGSQTIFQFKQGQRIPAIFVEQNGGWNLVTPHEDGAYYYIPRISSSYKLKIGYSEATIKYLGSDRESHSNVGPVNALNKRSYAAVAKGDDFVWADATDHSENSIVFQKGTAKVSQASAKTFSSLAKKLLDAKSIEVFGYSGVDDDSDLGRRRVDAIVNSLTSFGVERARIKTISNVRGSSDVRGGEIGARVEYVIAKIRPSILEKPSIQSKGVESSTRPESFSTLGKQLYRIEKTDTSILGVLSRWGDASGWKVIDVNFPHIKLEGSTDQEIAYGTFLEAVDKINAGLRRKGYTGIDGKAYSDNIIEIGVFDGK